MSLVKRPIPFPIFFFGGGGAQALAIKPAFVRARYNLGVSCINIGCHKEAAEVSHRARPTIIAHAGALPGKVLNASFAEHERTGHPTQHLLSALAMHGGGHQRNVSQNLWDTLRRTFIMMQRPDLQQLAQQQNVDLFRSHFEF